MIRFFEAIFLMVMELIGTSSTLIVILSVYYNLNVPDAKLIALSIISAGCLISFSLGCFRPEK